MLDDYALGSASNILLNGGGLQSSIPDNGGNNGQNAAVWVLSGSRTLTIGADGGTIIGGNTNGNDLTIAEGVVINSTITGTDTIWT